MKTNWMFVFTLSLSMSLWASPPQNDWLALQGVLFQPNGMRVEDGSYASCFRIFASATGGSPLWQECDRLTVKNGFYQTWLGDMEPLPFLEETPVWVEVEIDQEILPGRMALTGSPSAWRSKAVTDSIFPNVRMGRGVAVKSLNGLQNDVVFSVDSSLVLEPVGDTLKLRWNASLMQVRQDLAIKELQSEDSTLSQKLDSIDTAQTSRLLGMDSSLREQILSVDSATQRIIGFHSEEQRLQAERMATSSQNGLLSAQDFAAFQAKGDLHKNDLKVLRIIPTVQYDLVPICDRNSDGSLYYRRQWGGEESGRLKLCRYNGSYKVYAWESLL